MGNKIRIKQIDLQGIISASGQVNLLSASNYVSFVTQLDTTMSSDVELAAVSSSISQSIYTINQILGSGLISGSSQLTSSYDSRYVLSGSITQTTWDNIANKPSDIVSSSTQISNLGFVTGSYTTINSFNSLTQSFNSISQSFNVISGSVVNIQGGFDTGSYQTFTSSVNISISNLNTFTASQSTSSLVNRLNAIESVSGSWITESETGSFLTSLSGAISSSEQVLGGSGIYSSSAQIQGNIYSAGSSFTFQDLLLGAGTTFGKITTDGSKYISVMPTYNVESTRFWPNGNVTIQDGGDYVDNGFKLEVSGSTRIVGSFNVIGGITGSTNFDTIANKPTLISGSSQLTSSYDTRYTLSGSVQPLPSNLVSSSAQITAFGFISSSTAINTGSFATTSSLNTLSSSVDSRLDTLEATIVSGSPNYTQVLGNRRTGITTTGVSIISGSITTNGNPVQIMVTGDANPVNVSSWTRLQIYRDETAIGNIVQVENSSNLNVPYCVNVIDTPSAGTYSYSMRTVSGISGLFDFGESTGPTLTAVELNSKTSFPSGTISGSSQLTSSFDTRYTLSGSVQPLPSNLISGSSQLTSSFEVRGSGIYSSSAQLPNGLISGSSQLPSGIISGSSQLTASYDTRYTLSGSVVSGTTPAGTISGSSQLTSSYDGRYVQTGSFNTLTSSFNSFTASAQSVTTGSNTFIGTQTITGSLNITTGNIIASAITANTSSLYLTSGSNLYVQNNGIVEITGSLVVTGETTFSGSVRIGPGGGSEGGEINLAYAPTNNTLTGSAVAVDVYQNRVRIFEGGGNSRGVFVDLTKAPNGVGGELMWKASGFVNAGVDVTLGNLKARIPTSGNRSLQISTIAGTYSVYGSSVYSYNGIGGVTVPSGTPINVTTTPTYLASGYTFIVAGSTDVWNIMDTSAGIAWRITMIIGADFNNNMISIERLV
jgi:hypothetical protein